MTYAISDPRWLALVLLAVPLGYVMLRWCVAMTRLRRWSAVALRTLLLLTIAAMLAGLSSVRETNRLAVVAVVDVSESVRRFGFAGFDDSGERLDVIRAAERFLLTLDETRGPDDLLGVVAFAGESVAVATPTSATIEGRDFDIALTEGTGLEQAIRLGSALIPPDATGRVLLLSDGNETSGDALSAAEEIAARASGAGVGVDVVPIEFSVGAETIVESVIVPSRAPSETIVTARVVLAATDTTTGTLTLTSEGQPIDLNGSEPGVGRRLELGPGRHAILVDVPIGAGRIHRFEATYEPDTENRAGARAYLGDTHLDNNSASGFTVSPGDGSILIVDGIGAGDPSSAGAILANRLEETGADVRLIAPESLPTDLLSYQPFDLVILQDVPADAVSEEAQNLLAAHVRDMGAGLIMTGGPQSFGSGGWAGTPIEPILPVELDLSEKLIERRSAIVLVLDASGSMNANVGGSFRSQQDIANAAAATAVRSLGEADLVGVIKFGNAASWVRELAPNNDPEGITAAIESIGSGGGTNIPPALELARRALVNAEAAVKHVIVLSDGQSQGADQLPDIAAQLAAEDINLSTISVGDGADVDTMYAMAQRGGGVHYPVTNPSVLPRIFVRAVRIVRDPLIKEGLFTPVRLPDPSPALSGIDDLQPLEGLVLTAFRDDPLVTNALATPEGEPVLSHWGVGLGRVAAFTSDAHDWARPWLSWEGYDAFWSQLARLIGRSPAPPGIELATEIDSGEMVISMLALSSEGRPLDGLIVPAAIYTPGGERASVTLEQIGPGRYEGRMDAGESGNYVAVVKPLQDGQPMPPVLGGATQSSSVEYRSLEANTGLLRTIATQTGGRVLNLGLPDASVVFDRASITPRRAERSLWRPLLVAAIVLMLLDVATRRIAWDRGLAERRLRPRAEAAAASAGSLSSLKKSAPRDNKSEAVRLTEEDAARLAIEARRQRLASRQQRPSSKPAAPATPASSEESKVEVQSKKAKEEPESGLLAAKRRARERFEEDQQ